MLSSAASHQSEAEIAEKVGVTERTFFRHFPDKREVLFDGDAVFIDAVMTALRNAPGTFGPRDALFFALNSVKQIFIERTGRSLTLANM